MSPAGCRAVPGADVLIQHLVGGLAVGSIYAAMALGLTLVYGLLRILHIAHAGVYVAGAYAAYYTYMATGDFLLAVAASMLVSAAIGVAIERTLYLPMLDKPRHVPLMLSIALFILMEELIANMFGHYPKGFHVAGFPTGTVDVGGIAIRVDSLTVLFVTLAATIILWLLLTKTKMGIASQALIQDPEVAMALGVNMPRIVDINFALGSALAGFAGLLYGAYYGSISPYMGDVVAYKGLVVIVLGGFGSIMGALLGGLILGVAEEYLTAYFGYILPREAYAFIVLIILLIIRPQGLLGRKE